MSYEVFLTILSFILPHRYEPTMDILTDISTETDRVLFIKAVAEFMVTLSSEFVIDYLILFRSKFYVSFAGK